MTVPEAEPARQKAFSFSRKSMILSLFAVGLVGMIVLGFSHQILTIDSGEEKADAIIVLGGGSHQLRPEHAADLFKKGLAPLVLVSGTGDFDLNVQGLEKNGVPASAIIIESRSKSTLQNARFSIDILRQHNMHRAIIVTSWYHSRRALHCFQQLGPDLQFVSCPSYWGYPFSEWLSQGVIGYLVYEYVKLIGYWICYGIRPF